jgi:tetratricopeptide (TPR) repeat protein
MTKYLLVFLTIFTSALQAQDVLKFDKRFVESEDKWVAFNKGKDSTYMYGFIYIDAQAGLTLNYEGTFTISDSGKFIPEKIENSIMKTRLRNNNVHVAFIPENKFAELRIDTVPDWLKIYKSDTASVERLYHWGFMYNGWNECAKALTYLERAQKINPKFEGLPVELAFSYNCLGQFDKAVLILQSELKENPADAYTNKELVYALIKSGQLSKAANACKKAIAICPDKFNGEMCYNILHSYFEKKDKANFNLWAAETRKWTSSNPSVTRSIAGMESDLAK